MNLPIICPPFATAPYIHTWIILPILLLFFLPLIHSKMYNSTQFIIRVDLPFSMVCVLFLEFPYAFIPWSRFKLSPTHELDKSTNQLKFAVTGTVLTNCIFQLLLYFDAKCSKYACVNEIFGYFKSKRTQTHID